tara:strand:- start:1607 stop:1804 length:198 start_codon:yes stop_codon:yes gene_type:complete
MKIETDCIEKMKQLVTGIMVDTQNLEDRTPYAQGMRAAAIEMEWIIKDCKKLKKIQENQNDPVQR